MSVTISSPVIFAAAIVAALLVIALLLRARLPLVAKLGFSAAAMLLACATGGIALSWPRSPDVVVMVDLSPSTRSASYRDPAALRARIERLLPGVQHRLLFFAREEASDGDRSKQSPQRLEDIRVDDTKFSPPAVDAVVLLSDGQFSPPGNSPPVFAVVDSGIVNTGDAAIKSGEIRGDSAVAHVRNRGSDRVLSWDGGKRNEVAHGSYAIEHALAENDNSVAARLNDGDAWPENDSGFALRAIRPGERTWIGPSAPNGWRDRAGDELDRDPAAMLNSSVITLAISADQLTQAAQNALVSYVRDLGGTLILRGGPNGFAAGGFTGTRIDAISPLASSPPEPTRQWILVVDASGSMAATVDGSTRFDRAVSAMKSLLGNLPPKDIVQIGSIAEQFTAWSAPQLSAELSKNVAPPANLTPRGPTILEPFLKLLANATDTLPREVVIITDGEADLSNPTQLGVALRDAGVRLHLLLIGGSTRNDALRDLTKAAGGEVRSESDARNWSTALLAMTRMAAGETTIAVKQRVRFEFPIDSDVPIEILNRTWPREARVLARMNEGEPRWPIAAEWPVGGGRVIALAFEADGGLIDRVAQAFAAPPRDPRFSISVQMRDEILVELTARDQTRPMNQLRAALRPVAGGESIPFSQVAPGLYRANLPRANVPRTFDVFVGDQAIDLIALPPMFAREFDEIGLNRANLIALTERFGGAVIEADDTRLIALPKNTTVRHIGSACAAAAAMLVLATLVYLRLR